LIRVTQEDKVKTSNYIPESTKTTKLEANKDWKYQGDSGQKIMKILNIHFGEKF